MTYHSKMITREITENERSMHLFRLEHNSCSERLFHTSLNLISQKMTRSIWVLACSHCVDTTTLTIYLVSSNATLSSCKEKSRSGHVTLNSSMDISGDAIILPAKARCVCADRRDGRQRQFAALQHLAGEDGGGAFFGTVCRRLQYSTVLSPLR